MGWADCGEDSKGRPIGYNHESSCDFEGCTEVIDRGLAYACAGMHGDVSHIAQCEESCKEVFHDCCDGYFCSTHAFEHDCTYTRHVKEMEWL